VGQCHDAPNRQVMELSENFKLSLESQSGETQQDRAADTPDPAVSGESTSTDDAESQMRKALGLLGESSRHRPDAERMDPPNRMGDRFGGGLHRRRFVQDGDIPVTVLRRDQGFEAPNHRGTALPTAPTTSRLQRVEAALSAETAAREKAERALAETQSVVRDLQTKIGHAELARNEAIEALLGQRESLTQLRAEHEVREERLLEALGQARVAEHDAHICQEQLADERLARKTAEKALRIAEAARETAEQLVKTLSEEMPTPVQTRVAPTTRRSRVVVEPEVVAVTAARRGRPVEAVATEPEPVKWWLNTKPAGKRR
jgi:hypothetical protein